MRFPFFRNRDSVKNGILISIRRTGDGFHPGLFIVLHPREKYTPQKMAEMVELSKQRFSSLFKANMGKSPMEYVREIRLTTAARALLVSNKNINDIAYECGYEDANYFIREFKSAFGFTPNQYRKIARE